MSNAKHLAEPKKAVGLLQKDWFNLTVAGIARVILLGAASMLLWALVPAVLGWHVTTTMSGSMEPRVMTGDVVVSMPYDSNKVMPGQVILAPDPAKPEHLRFHRVLKPGDNGTVITKGDNNPQADSDPIKRKDIVGVGVLRIPGLGLPALWMQQHNWVPLSIALVGLPLLFAISRRDLYLRQQLEAARRQEAVAFGKDPDPTYVRALKRVTPKRLHNAGPQAKAVTSIALVLVLVGGAVTLRGSESTFTSIDENSSNVTATPDLWDCFAPAQRVNNFYYGFNEANASNTVAADSGVTSLAQPIDNDAVIIGGTKKAGTCSNSPYFTLNGSTSVLYSSSTTAFSARSPSISVAFRTSVKKAVTVAEFTNKAGPTAAATATYASVQIDADGTLTTAVAYDNNGTATCRTVPAATQVADGQWHWVTVSRIANSNGQTLRVYVDGVLSSSLNPTNTSSMTFAGFLRAGYSPASTGLCADTVHTGRFTGDIDELAAAGSGYNLLTPGGH